MVIFKLGEYLNRLLKVEPKFTVADRLLAYTTKYKDRDGHLKEMEEKNIRLKLNDNQQANLLLSLGKAYEDLKEYDQSFQYYSKGNSLLKKNSNFEIKDEIKNLKISKKFFKMILKRLKQKKQEKSYLLLVCRDRARL